jgi:hypothetical protein
VHKKIIVTSNYTINELIKDSDDDMVAAIKRRFKCTVFSDHPFNGNQIRLLDPVARGLWNQCGISQDDVLEEIVTQLLSYQCLTLVSAVSASLEPGRSTQRIGWT